MKKLNAEVKEEILRDIATEVLDFLNNNDKPILNVKITKPDTDESSYDIEDDLAPVQLPEESDEEKRYIDASVNRVDMSLFAVDKINQIADSRYHDYYENECLYPGLHYEEEDKVLHGKDIVDLSSTNATIHPSFGTYLFDNSIMTQLLSSSVFADENGNIKVPDSQKFAVRKANYEAFAAQSKLYMIDIVKGLNAMMKKALDDEFLLSIFTTVDSWDETKRIPQYELDEREFLMKYKFFSSINSYTQFGPNNTIMVSNETIPIYATNIISEWFTRIINNAKYNHNLNGNEVLKICDLLEKNYTMFASTLVMRMRFIAQMAIKIIFMLCGDDEGNGAGNFDIDYNMANVKELNNNVKSEIVENELDNRFNPF